MNSMTFAMARQFIGSQQPLAMHVAATLTPNRDEASELAQEGMCRALVNWRRMDPARSPGAWLRTVMRHALIDSRRKSAQTASLDVPTPNDGVMPSEFLTDGEASPLELLLRREVAERVRQVLSRLNCHHRIILRACDLEGGRYEEVAAVFGIPLGTLRSRLSRARATFRRQWALAGGEGLV